MLTKKEYKEVITHFSKNLTDEEEEILMNATDIHVCPWCNSNLPEKEHTIMKFKYTYMIGCPKYTRLEPTYLNKELYKINSPGRIIL